MKKRLKGLISCWLAVAMLFSSVSVSFAAETGEVQSTYARYYKGSEALKLNDNVWILQTSAIDNLYYGEGAYTLTSQVSSLEEENRPENKILVGWNLWAKHNSGDLNAGPIEKSLTDVVTEDDITFCENNDSNYHDPLIEPRYVDKYKIEPQPTNETFTVGGKVYDLDRENYVEADNVSYQWYGIFAEAYTVVGSGNSGDWLIEGDIEAGDCSDDGVWSSDTEIVMFFPTEAGDVIKVTPITSDSSSGLNATVVGYDDAEHNYTLTDGAYCHEAETAASDYGLMIADFAEGDTFKIEVIRYGDASLLSGQDKATLNTDGIADGLYFCRLTFDESGENIVLESEKVEFAYTAPAHEHPICGATHTDIGDHTGTCENITWTAWDGTDKDGATDGIQLTAGSWYLTDNVTLTETLIISSGEVNLCLNGHKISSTADKMITLESGATLNICDCQTTKGSISGCGEYCIYNNGGTVTVYDGTVSTSGNNGCGIYNHNNGGTVNIYDGNISGTHSGIYNYNGTTTVSGGTVTGEYGIYCYYGTLNLSGAPTVTGTTADINLSYGTVITITGALTRPENPISVWMHTPGEFTSSWSSYMSSAAPGSYFTSAHNGYGVAKANNGELQLVPHVHDWTYSYDDMTKTITATCHGTGTCTNPTSTYELTIANDVKYSASYACPITAAGNWSGANAGTIVVTDNGLNNDLTNGLKGTATIKVNDTTVTTETTYTLQKADNAFTTAPVAIKGLTYTGEPLTLINAGSGVRGDVYYKVGENGSYSTDLPTATNADTYTVYYKVVGGNYYKDIAESSLTVEIGKATPEVTVPTAKDDLLYNGNDQQLLATAGSTTGGTLRYIASEEPHIPVEDAVWSTEVPTAKNATTHYIWYKVVGDNNYYDVSPAYVEVTIAKADINPTVSIDGWVYGQSANAPSVTGNTGNGAVTYYYKAQGADDNTYTTAVPSEVGNYTVKAVIAETGNYNGASATADFSIAYASMSAQDAFGYIYDADVWANTDITFTAKNGYTVSDTAAGSGYDSTCTGTEEGLGVTKTVYVKDSEGKVSQVELKYNLDKTAPGISTVSGNPTEWTKDNAVISFTATDAPSGVASVVVTYDDGEDVAYDTGSFTADRNGTYTITVTDKAGNQKTETVTVSKIDKAAPSLQIGVPTGTGGNDGWFTSAVTVPVAAGDGDGESGLDKWYYSLNGGTNWTEGSNGSFVISADGDYNQTVKIKAVDKVGNETVTTIAQVKVDTTAPGSVSVTAKVGESDYVSGEWTTGNVKVTLSATDTTSGIRKYQYSTDNGENWTDIVGDTYTHTASTDETGVTYRFRAVDNAGNVGEASGSITVKKRQPYTITFNANGGTGNMDSLTAYVDAQIELTENAFTREGYTFTGWNTAADGSGTAYADKANVTNLAAMNETATLYAQWAVNEYKVTWINYGDDGWEKYFDYGESITLPTIPDFAIMMHKLGYTQTGWLCSDDTVEIGDTMPAKDLTFTAQYTPNTYTVKFDANGGTGDMADQSFTYDAAAQALTTNAYTCDGYKFMGWAESADATGVDYVDKQVVSNLNAAPNGEVILYAVWTRDIILSGDIVAPNVSDAENLDVVLVGLDGTEYPVSVTGSQSPYHYTVTVPEGEYQLIVKDTRDGGVTVTAKEELTEDKTEETITMPTGNKNSIVDSENAGEYAPIVGGIDAIAEDTAGTNVTVTLTVTHEPANEEDAEHDALMDAAGSQKSKLTFLEIDLAKNVDGTQSAITQTDDAIEIVIPFDTTRKQNFKVYRFHDDNGNSDVDEGEVDILTTAANGDGEHIIVGTGNVTIHAKFFSLYAIGYNDVIPYYPVTHSCTSKCDVCGGCEDAACTESACKDKCRLLGMNFTDVADGKWYTEPVAYVYHHKMMEGVGNNLFDINGTTTRAMIVTILWRLEGEPVVNYLMQFEDIPADTWYTEAVRWAASEKIVEGYSDTAFGPTDPITREQFATILWRYAKYKGYDVSVGEDTNILSYEDAFSISEYAIPAMQWACGAGLMQGDGVNLTPKADTTRAQAAALFQRFCENVAEK